MKKQLFAAAILSSFATFAAAFGGGTHMDVAQGVTQDVTPIGEGHYLKFSDVIQNLECMNNAFKNDLDKEKGLSVSLNATAKMQNSADGKKIVYYFTVGECPRIEAVKISHE